MREAPLGGTESKRAGARPGDEAALKGAPVHADPDDEKWLARLSDQSPDSGQHRTLFYGESSNRVRGTRESVAAEVQTREAEKPPPIRELVRVAEHADGWGVPAEWE